MRSLTMLPRCSPLACVFILLASGILGDWVLCICPSMCSCSRGHRVVDCSSRGLTRLPPGLQHNIRSLNLSFNSLWRLDSQLSHYAHLRTLDLSFNRLEHLPPALPKSLWELRTAGNHLHTLDKNDTAYHWNLRVLDLSDNELERVVFINNTLPSLHDLNLSKNRFWTVPTNMPHNLEAIDLSHNYLVKILPGSLDRLPRLERFYLHANRFSWLPDRIFDRLTGLQLITLGDNPWACEEEENITRLLRWAEQTHATVSGCPCYTRPTCGQAHLATPGGERHFAAHTELPFGAGAGDIEHGRPRPPARTAESTAAYQAKSALVETSMYGEERGGANASVDQMLFDWTSSTSLYSLSTRTSTTARPRSAAKKPNVGNTRSKGHRLVVQNTPAVTMNILVIVTAFNAF